MTLAMRPLQAEVQRVIAQQALIVEHVFLNGAVACEWSPNARGCVICRWHNLDHVAPL